MAIYQSRGVEPSVLRRLALQIGAATAIYALALLALVLGAIS